MVSEMGRDRQQQLRLARLIASVAATVISLACGTNVGPPPSPPFFFQQGVGHVAVDGILISFVHFFFPVASTLTTSWDMNNADVFLA